MASYKQPCLQCGSFIDRDSLVCPSCGSRNAFGYHCPTCKKTITKGQRACSECGRPLYVPCPYCAKPTFVADRCDHCGMTLLKQCENSRCGAWEFFENVRCTTCGKKMKTIRRKSPC